MTAVGVYDQIKKAFQDVIAPELHALRGDIRVIDSRIAGLDQKIDGVDQKLSQKIDAVDQKLSQKIDGLDQKIDGVDARLTVKIDALRTEVVAEIRDRKSTRLNSSHVAISYAVFCLKKKKNKYTK